MATVRDLCTASLQRIGVIAAGETPASEDLQLALDRLNVLKDSWRTQRLFTSSLVRTVFAINPNTPTYTVGAGGDINIARPVFPQRIRLIDTTADPDQELPLMVLTDAQYAAIPQKSLTAPWPTHVYYNPTSPLGTMVLWPVPTASTLAGAIYTPNASGVLALTDVLDVPAGYQLLYQENLAVHIAPDFDRQPSTLLLESANTAMADVKRANLRLTDLAVITPFGGGGQYDIQSDTVI